MLILKQMFLLYLFYLVITAIWALAFVTIILGVNLVIKATPHVKHAINKAADSVVAGAAHAKYAIKSLIAKRPRFFAKREEDCVFDVAFSEA